MVLEGVRDELDCVGDMSEVFWNDCCLAKPHIEGPQTEEEPETQRNLILLFATMRYNKTRHRHITHKEMKLVRPYLAVSGV